MVIAQVFHGGAKFGTGIELEMTTDEGCQEEAAPVRSH
jgi:hypothetical protein